MPYAKLTKEALTRFNKNEIRVTFSINENAKVIYYDPSIKSNIVKKKGIEYISAVEDNE